MGKEIIRVPIFNKSIAELILDHESLSRFKRYLLRKLIPKDLWEAPTIKLGELAKGTVITDMVMTSTSLDTDLDIGYEYNE